MYHSGKERAYYHTRRNNNTKCHCLSQKKPRHILHAPLGTMTSNTLTNTIATVYLKIEWHSRAYEHILVMVDIFPRCAQGHATRSKSPRTLKENLFKFHN